MEAKQTQFYLKNAVSVKEIGYHEDKNYPSRLNMEDCTDLQTQITCRSITSTETDQDFLEFLMGTEAARYHNTARR
jgi:hypothetical protein